MQPAEDWQVPFSGDQQVLNDFIRVNAVCALLSGNNERSLKEANEKK